MFTDRKLVVLTTKSQADREPYLSLLAGLCGHPAACTEGSGPPASPSGTAAPAIDIAVQTAPILLTTPRELCLVEVPRRRPLASLLSLAARHDVEGIVVPASVGHSLACRLVHQAACSIWWVPEGVRPQVKRVLVPVDYSVHAADALRVATGIGSLSRGECVALHVYFDDAVLIADSRRQQIRFDVGCRYQRFIDSIDCLGVSIRPEFVEAGNVARAIASAAVEQNADLIVLSTCGRSRLAGLLRPSIASRLIPDSPVPVLVLKHFGAKRGIFAALRARDDASRDFLRCN